MVKFLLISAVVIAVIGFFVGDTYTEDEFTEDVLIGLYDED